MNQSQRPSIPFFNSLGVRLTVILVLLALIPLAIGAYVNYVGARNELTRVALDKAEISTEAAVHDIQTLMQQFQADLLSLSETPPIQGIIRARDNGGIDPVANDSYEVWVERLNQIFVPIAENKQFYQQLRYLDSDGIEMVRVDYNGQRAIVIPPEELQDKSDRDYFQEAIELDDDEVYISELNLNRERGKISVPLTPVLRFATPVFDEVGQRRGIVVLNVYANSFLSLLEADVLQQIDIAEEDYLVSEDGYYLHHPFDINKEFGFDLGTDFNANQDFPTIMNRMANRETLSAIDEETGQVVSAQKIRFDPRQPERYWILIERVPTDTILAGITRVGYTIIGVTALLVLVAAVVAILLARTITRPVTSLARASEQIAAGEWDAPLPEAGRDEIGLLSQNFARMTTRLRELIDSLQARSEQMAAQTEQLEANQRAIQVIFGASEGTSPDTLLAVVVNLIRDQFNLYHVQVYMVDQERQTAVLRKSTGYAGRQLLRQSHQIPLDQPALVTRAIHQKEPVAVADVSQEAGFLPNPLLPDTQSELVVPLQAGQEVIGALDAQSREVDTFNPAMIELFQTMAEQVALLFQNSKLFAQTAQQAEASSRYTNQLRIAAEIAERLSAILEPDQLLHEVVELMQSRFGFYHAHIYLLNDNGQELTVRAGSGEVGNVLKERGHAIPLDREQSLVAQAARSRQSVLVNDVTLEAGYMANPLLPETRSEVAVPLLSGDRTLGVLDVQDDQVDRFSDIDLATFNTLAGQIATALENAYLFVEQQETEEALRQSEAVNQKRAAELQIVAEVSAAVSTILETEVLLQTVVDLTKSSFDLYHAHIYLLDKQNNTLQLAAGADEVGRQMTAEGWQIGLDEEHSIVARAARTREGVIINDVRENPHFLPNPLLPDTRAEMAIPIIGGEVLLGVLDVQSQHVGRFTEEDLRIKTTLAGQIVVALQNADLFEQVEQSLAETHLRLETSQALTEATTEEAVLDVLMQQASFYARARVSLYLIDPDAETQTFVLHRDAAFESGLPVREAGTRFPVDQFPVAAILSPDKLFVSENVREDARFDQELDYTSLLVMPITVGGEWLGLLVAASPQPAYFDESKEYLYRTLAEQVGSALYALRLQNEILEREERLETIMSASPIPLLVSRLPDGMLMFANPQFGEMFKLALDEIINRATPDFYADLADRRIVLDQLAAEGEVNSYELQLKRSDGSIFWASLSIRIIEFEGARAALTAIYDISYRKEAEESLRRYATIVETATEAIISTAPDGTILSWNPAAERIFGYTAEESVGQTVRFLTPPDRADEVRHILGQLRTGEEPGSVETKRLTKDGREIDVLLTLSNITNEAGELIGNSAIIRDITERKQAEQERIRFTRQLRTAADVSEQITAILDPDELLRAVVDLIQERLELYHAHIYLLDEAEERLVVRAGSGEAGRIMEEEGHSIPLDREQSLVARAARQQELVAVADISQTPDFMPNPLLPDTRSEAAVPIISGENVLGVLDVQDAQVDRFGVSDLDVLSTLAGQIATALDNARLFAEQTRTEHALRESEEKFRSLLEHAPDGIILVDDEGQIELVNRQAEIIFGYSRQEMQGQNIEMLLPERYRTGHIRFRDAFLHDPESRVMGAGRDLWALRRDGTEFPVEVGLSAVNTADGVLVMSYITDITNRKQAEAERERLIAILSNSQDMIALTDLAGAVTYINPAGARMAGYNRPEEAVGKAIPDFHEPEALRRVQEEGLPIAFEEGTWRSENEILRQDGEIVPVDQSIFIIRDQAGQPQYLATIMTDITNRKESERERERLLSETQTLYESSRGLTTASTPAEVMDVIAGRAAAEDAVSAALIYVDTDAQGEPEWAEIMADWHADASPPMVGIRYYLPEFPLYKLWLSSREPQFIDDLISDERVDSTSREAIDMYHSGLRAMAILPLISGGRWRGLMTIGWNRPHPFTEQAERIYRAFALQTASVVQSQRLFDQTRNYALQLETAADVSERVSSILDPAALLAEVVTLLRDQFDLYHAHIYLLDETSRDLVITAGSGTVGQKLLEKEHKIPFGREQSLVARAARNRQLVNVADTENEPGFMPNPLLPDTRSEVAVPLIAGDAVLGVLDVQDDRPYRFTAADLNVFSTLAGQIATALQNARLYEESLQTADRLREMDRLKSEFLANMSHELRTPLNSIIGYSEMMLMGISGELPPDLLEDIEAIHENGQHLLHIISDILDLAKIEAGRLTLNLEEVSIAALLEDIRINNAGLFVNKPLEFLVEIEEDLPEVEADPVRLNQVINNLLSNAVKFTGEGHIRLRASQQDGGVNIEVEDTGIGISEEDLESIFEKFRQVDGSYTRRAEGTGLGLAITRYLVQMHGGDIFVRSQLGQGTTFTVRLPVDEAN